MLMGAYEFQALDAKGKEKKGVLQGDTARQVRQQLREQGLAPLEVLAVSESAGNDIYHRSGASLKRSEFSLFIRQLAGLVGAALPLEEALATTASQAESQRSKKVLVALRSRVMEGQSLSAAMSEFPKAFPEMYRASIAAGEQSGRLDLVLNRLADYAESSQELNRNTISALIYPLILGLVAIAVVISLMTYVVPQVITVFDSFDRKLPVLTRIMVGISDFWSNYGLWIGIAFAATLLAIPAILRIPAARLNWDRMRLRIPLAGRLIRAQQAARMTRTLSLLTASAVPLLEALNIAGRVLTVQPMRLALEQAAARVREGASLHKALEQSGQFPPLVLQLIASGEKSGELDDMLERAADLQDRQVNATLSIVSALLGPVMILFVGGMVLLIVLAILLPIFQMNSLIQ